MPQMPDNPPRTARLIEPMQHSFTLLPLAGSLALGYDQFAYFFMGNWENGIEITSPTWLSHCYLLNEMDLVNLHLPFKKGHKFHSKGVVESIRTEPGKKEKIYRLRFIEEPAYYRYPYHIDIEERSIFVIGDHQLINMFMHCIRECILLKKGVAVYIKHLAAYFSRLVGHHHANYALFNRFFFQDILNKLREKVHQLEVMQTALLAEASKGTMDSLLDFQDMHEIISSEVNLDVINLAFKEGDHLTYILAIKELEEKLYWQYNGMLLIYEHTIRHQQNEQPTATKAST